MRHANNRGRSFLFMKRVPHLYPMSHHLVKIPPERRGGLAQVIEYLKHENLLDDSSVELFGRLRNLRNLAVHAGTQRLTAGEALEYRALCRMLSDKLDEVFSKLPP